MTLFHLPLTYLSGLFSHLEPCTSGYEPPHEPSPGPQECQALSEQCAFVCVYLYLSHFLAFFLWQTLTHPSRPSSHVSSPATFSWHSPGGIISPSAPPHSILSISMWKYCPGCIEKCLCLQISPSIPPFLYNCSFVHSFVCLFRKYVLRTYYMPGIVLGTGDSAMYKIPCPLRADILVAICVGILVRFFP